MYQLSYPASEFGFVDCGARTYTFTMGTFTVVTKSTDPSSIPAAHIIARNVQAQDQDGTVYRVQGTETYDDAGGLLVAKFLFLGRAAGRVDSLNIVAKDYEQGGHGFSFGTCSFA